MREQKRLTQCDSERGLNKVREDAGATGCTNVGVISKVNPPTKLLGFFRSSRTENVILSVRAIEELNSQ